MDHEQVQNVEEIDGDEELEEDIAIEIDNKNIDNICYSIRLKKLIKEVIKTEGIEARVGKNAIIRLQETIRYLAVALAFELSEELKKYNRISVKPILVDEALTNVLRSADSLKMAKSEIEALIQKLETLSETKAISKAFEYVNIIEKATKAEGEGRKNEA